MEAKRLYRSREHKMIGGVCAGLGNYLNIDLVLMRLIFVFGLIIPACDCFFFLTYIALWIAAPLEPKVVEPIKDESQPKDDLNTANPPKEEVI